MATMQRFIDTYFRTYPGIYFTGDGCRRDEDGYYWITGRVDDVINVSGHRLGTAEVEIALVANRKVAEAAVVGFPHDIKGQGIYAYVTLKAGADTIRRTGEELKQWVAGQIGPIARPDVIQFAPGLPKTRSGKIMRRILRKIAENDVDQSRRHINARRSFRGRRSREEPENGLTALLDWYLLNLMPDQDMWRRVLSHFDASCRPTNCAVNVKDR